MILIQRICSRFTNPEIKNKENEKEIKINLIINALIKLNPIQGELTPLYLGSFLEKKGEIILNLKRIKQIDDGFVGDFAFRVIFEKTNQAHYNLFTILCYECEISQRMADDLKEILREVQKKIESKHSLSMK